MSFLEFLHFRNPVALALPAGEYAFLHMFDQEANGRLINGECQLLEVSLPRQLEALSQTLDLNAKCLEDIDLNELTVTTYLTPIAENSINFRKLIIRMASKKNDYSEGFAADGLFTRDAWSYRNTSYCGSWLIMLNCHDPELRQMNTMASNGDVA